MTQELFEMVKRYNTEKDYFKIEAKRYMASMKAIIKHSNLLFEKAREEGISPEQMNKFLEGFETNIKDRAV